MFLIAQKILKIVIIVKFSSRRKSSDILHNKKKLKNIDGSKFDFNAGVKLYINESLCPYYRGLWGKCKKLWLDKVIFSFYTINGILRIKKCERDRAIPITHDEDLWQFQEAE